MAVAVGSVGFRSPASHSLWRPPGSGSLALPQLTLAPPQASDNFNRANGTLAGSNGWVATSDGSATIVSNEASGAGAAAGQGYQTIGTYTSDQYAQATLGSVNNVTNNYAGLMLRHNAATGADYIGIYFINGAQPVLQMYSRTAAGAYGAVLVSANVAAQPVGAAMLFYAIGSVLVLQVGSSSISITDTTLTGGVPGLAMLGTMTLDNWSAGNASMGAALGAAIGSDNFNRINGPVSTGQPNWSPITASFSGVACSDAAIVANEVNQGDAAHHADSRNETYNADQWASLAMGSVAAIINNAQVPFVGVILRWNGTTGYLCCFFAGGATAPGTAYCIFVLHAGASSTLLVSCGTNGTNGSASPSNPTGTVYTGVCKGSRISMRVNGTEVLSATDSTCVGGQPAFQVFPVITADNFSAGNV